MRLKTTEPDPIILALGNQVVCYQRLAKLAEAQHDCVQRGQTEQLLDILNRRQEVLDQLAAFERTLAGVKRQWTEYVGRLDRDRREQAETLLAQTRRLLEEITAADRDDAMVLQQRKLNLGRQINKASAAKVVNRKYASSAYGAPRPGMDLKQ